MAPRARCASARSRLREPQYAHHFAGGKLQWPKAHKKPNALMLNPSTEKWLMPAGWYAITRRFSAKEEKRRIVSYVLKSLGVTVDDHGKMPDAIFYYPEKKW